MSFPPGIGCSPPCSQMFAPFDYGTEVRLTQTTEEGLSVFGGWELFGLGSPECGGGPYGSPECRVTVSADMTVFATFYLPLTCTTVSNASDCPNTGYGIYLGGLSATTCRSECETELASFGATSGCWIITADGGCYCDGGVLASGSGTLSGGSCAAPPTP
jgi:hypothetical protein